MSNYVLEKVEFYTPRSLLCQDEGLTGKERQTETWDENI